MGRRTSTGKAKQQRPSHQDVVDRSHMTIAAVHHCLVQPADQKIGARKVIRLTNTNNSLMFPGTTRNEVDRHLQKLSKLNMSDWTIESVTSHMYPDRRHTTKFLLTSRENQQLVDFIIARNKAGKNLPRRLLRNQIRLMLLERRKRNNNPKYKCHPLNTAAERICAQSTQDNIYPANTWFRRFFKDNSDQVHETSETVKDVQRGRATDAHFLFDDMQELHENLFDLGIMDDKGLWIQCPEDANHFDPGWYARSKVFQTDEKGQFFYYDVEKGRMARIKFAAAVGCSALRIAQENRQSFSYVPWTDANGNVLFCQLLFKGVLFVASNLAQNLATAYVLIQYTVDGNQNVETFAEALEYLDARLREFHDNDPLICGPDVERVVTTDGHYSRKGALTFATALRVKIHVQVRMGAASFITQMWDQLFHMFANEYQKMVQGFVAIHESTRANEYDVFKMQKSTITAIIAGFHQHGRCTWCTQGDIIEKFAVVGLTRAGIDVKRLLDNALVLNAPNAVRRRARFDVAKLPRPLSADTTRPQWESPVHLRKSSHEYLTLKCRSLEKINQSYLANPEDIIEAQTRLLAPTDWQVAVVGPLVNMLAKAPQTSLLTVTPRPLQPIERPDNTNVGQVHGLLTRNAWLLADRVDLATKKTQTVEKKKQADADWIALRSRYFACVSAASCVCAPAVCLVKTYRYCKECDVRGRDKCLQLTVCKKKDCAADRAASATVSPTQTSPSTSTQHQQEPSTAPRVAPITTTTPTLPPRIAPIISTPSSSPPIQPQSQPSPPLSNRLSLPDPDCTTTWNDQWEEGVFHPGDKLMIKWEVREKELWRLGYVILVFEKKVKIEYHVVGGGRKPIELCPKAYLTKERYGVDGWWMCLGERATAEAPRPAKRARVHQERTY